MICKSKHQIMLLTMNLLLKWKQKMKKSLFLFLMLSNKEVMTDWRDDNWVIASH
jgi:hypothetical protein